MPEAKPMSLRLFFAMYWFEGEWEPGEHRNEVILWEPLNTAAPEDASPACYCGGIDFWKPGGNAKYDERVRSHDFTYGAEPVCVYIRELDTWFESGLGRVLWRNGRWYMRTSAWLNRENAHFCNAGMRAWLAWRKWRPRLPLKVRLAKAWRWVRLKLKGLPT